MRMIIIFFLAFFIIQTAFSQQPTKEQLQDQMKQAKLETQQQIREMEGDIAEAKKNNEDPASIREMEKALTTLKKMLGVVDKAAIVSNQKPRNIEGVNSVAPYRSPFIPIKLQQ